MVKKTKKFNYKKNLKKAWKKLKEKKNPTVKNDDIKEFWDSNVSMKRNYANLGLSIDPNETLEIPRAKVLLNPEVMEIEKAKEISKAQKRERKEATTPAVKKLMEKANQPVEKVYNLNENDILFCIYMLEKYAENYESMERDYKNYYQLTAAQIRRKIELFKRMKGPYQKYLSDKKQGVAFLQKLDEKF